MAIVRQFTIMMENQRGALAGICGKLEENAVNIRALMVPDQGGVSPVRLIVDNTVGAERVFDALQIVYVLEPVLVMRIADHPG